MHSVTVSHSTTKPKWHSIVRGLRRIGIVLFHILLKGNEPIIQQRCNRKGEMWLIYDPLTCQTFYFPSEHEVRTWLDRRYYSD